MALDLIIFDLDGTLVDSSQDLANSVNATRVAFHLPPLANELVYSYVGNGAHVLIQKAMGQETGEEKIQRALEHFLNYYRQHMLDHTRLYPGVRQALDRLKAAGLQMAVLTNKPVRFSREILAGLGVGGHFFQVYGGNSFEQKKPDPAGVSVLMSESGVTKDRTMMVGDSDVDVLTARNAGVRVCGVTYGLQPESFEGARPDVLVDSMEQIADLVIAERNTREESRS